MQELGCTIDYLRKNADKYYIDKDKISVIGFSAGGHLVSSYGYLYTHPEVSKSINLSPENIKPNCRKYGK
jgi:acetyl esterase/lipase